jgi:NAD(P)-dependent dehydrogenase (short-subunit alcohol dehydrogenase family)
MNVLKDKVCVITGGAGSVGRACAELFLGEGAKVLLVDIDADRLHEVSSTFATERVAVHAADVGDAASVQAYLRAATDRWGAIDVLFSNAGNSGAIAGLAEYPEDAFDETYRVHVRGAFLACKYGISAMRDGGSLIINSSVAGLSGTPGLYAYVTAKHAQIGLMRAAAKEAAARRIRVNTIHPGPIDNAFQTRIEDNFSGLIGRDGTQFVNELIPLGRHATPAEIAQSVLYLASDQSSFTTGSMLVVDGGMNA